MAKTRKKRQHYTPEQRGKILAEYGAKETADS